MYFSLASPGVVEALGGTGFLKGGNSIMCSSLQRAPPSLPLIIIPSYLLSERILFEHENVLYFLP